ncbi:hypothetical protein [Lignipirellula cremea]|uniref:Uncharacterized protein n=1 Tax=Lignipirellula cremea TaxID=2528010 RepID=A0A518DP22_9BACT|nr:hypothetical protein [Lignipirellula cremea]QDU93590.1 hypothetical protein Pla8534_13700 [Lignipirellula cremea]
MGGRFQNAMIVVFWLLAMGWLTVFKIIPPLQRGNPPTYVDELPQDEEQSPPVVWKLHWNDHPMGYALRHAIRTPEGGELRSLVRLDGVELKELFGPLATFFTLGHDSKIDFLIASRMQVDHEGGLRLLDTVIDVDQISHCIEIQGVVNEANVLLLDASVSMSQEPGLPRHAFPQQSVPLPPGGQLGDGMSPRSEMHNLEIDQRWTIPVYRPFSPTRPTEILEARVARHEILVWGGPTIETFRVEYRSEAGAGISANSEPIAVVWVTGDGQVIQQEVMFSSLRLRFTRVPGEDVDPEQAKLVDDEHFDEIFRQFRTEQPTPPASNADPPETDAKKSDAKGSDTK